MATWAVHDQTARTSTFLHEVPSGLVLHERVVPQQLVHQRPLADQAQSEGAQQPRVALAPLLGSEGHPLQHGLARLVLMPHVQLVRLEQLSQLLARQQLELGAVGHHLPEVDQQEPQGLSLQLPAVEVARDLEDADNVVVVDVWLEEVLALFEQAQDVEPIRREHDRLDVFRGQVGVLEVGVLHDGFHVRGRHPRYLHLDLPRACHDGGEQGAEIAAAAGKDVAVHVETAVFRSQH